MIAVDLGEKTDEELSKGNCDRAIELALKSYEESLKWLGIYNDTLTEYNVSQLWMIQGAYTNVYDAYNCKAEKLYDSKNYSNALYFKIKADSFLNINPVARNDWWRNERATSKNDIGLCYDKLHQNDSAAIYFMKAAKYHSDTIKIQNVNLATYYNNLARSLAREQYWSESSQVAKQSILVLDKDSISEDKNNSYTRSYLRLVYNSLAENKLQEAEKYLSNIKNYLTPTKEGEYYLYQAILANSLENPLQAVNYAEKAKKLFIDLAGEKNPNVATCYTILFDAWMSIPDYDSAYINIQRGKEIAKENYSINSAKYAEFTNKEAYYLFLTGHYLESLDKFLDVKIAFQTEFGDESTKLPEIFSSIGRINIDIHNYDKAKQFANQGLRLANSLKLITDDRASNFLNDIGYVFYSTDNDLAADTLYRKTIKLNIKAKKDSSLAVASALNGLGLLKMRKSKYQLADSLFNRSLDIYRYHFSNLHPSIGVVLLNKSQLSMKRKEVNDALSLINQALDNYTPFHRNDHPIIGDMLYQKGSILTMKGDFTNAVKFLSDALKIYSDDSEFHHQKIRKINIQLRSIENIRR